jgi:thiol:disulfide interchange protein DsbD
MLDFHTDGCVDCKADDKALTKRLGLFGPSGLIFFNDGKEISNSRIIGFLAAEPFLQHLNRHFTS